MESRPLVSDVAGNFSEYLDRVVRRGERFVLMLGDQPVAELRPATPVRRLGEPPELLASLPRLSPEELDSFESDLEKARNELSSLSVRDPWGS
jgi:antitoxin (DNA-binding transcriptional repressor) of toxin-antitoxin stability system